MLYNKIEVQVNKNMKKITFFVIAQFLTMVFVANAQTATGVYSAGSGYTAFGVVGAPTIKAAPINSTSDSGFIQFNNLTVESISATSPPAEIVASNPVVYPMMGATSVSGVMPKASAAAPSVTCIRFNSESSLTGSNISCPATSLANDASTSAKVPEAGMNSAGSAVIVSPPSMPIRYQPYRIEVDNSTRLMLRDRTVASLADFSSGDQINVFGFYNGDGSIQAYIVRDMSKPVQDEFIQINNVDLISISGTALPATLIVAQTQGYPCYGFGITGNESASAIACPMGATLPDTAAPTPAMVPNWAMTKKYVVHVDVNTIILDRSRGKLSLSDLQIGDALNIYGNTTDNGQNISADILRDISVPPAPSTFKGSVTQVNADGSFVITADSGQVITVQNPIKTGVMVQLTGLLDRLSNVLTQISSMYIGNNSILPPPPVINQVTPY